MIMLRIATGVSTEEGETALIDEDEAVIATGIQLSRVSSSGARKTQPSEDTV